MGTALTPNTQATLLLTAPLILGRREPALELLTPGEYNRLEKALREKQKEPADLLGMDGSDISEMCGSAITPERVATLLGRGFQMSQAIEHWNARSIWLMSRADPTYPQRLKLRLKENAPPVLYGCGDPGLLEQGGLAIVGSREVTEDLVQYTATVGALAAKSLRPVVSGGARGIDKAAINGSLQAGGRASAVLADSLERAAVARENREVLMDNRLVLVSPYDPAAGFNVGNAMQRNKVIYALSDAALVVSTDFEKGGTWAGAIEQLERFRFITVFVRSGERGKGNAALLQHGGLPWPEPQNPAELMQVLATAVTSLATVPKQELLF